MSESVVEGIYLRKIFHNEENGFSIGHLGVLALKGQEETAAKAMKPADRLEHLGAEAKDVLGTANMSGYFPPLQEMSRYRFFGQWGQHPKFGWQFNATRYEGVQISGGSAVVQYLSSGIFAGIGKKTAQRVVDALGEDALTLILEKPEALDQVPKLTKNAAKSIRETLAQQQGAEQILTPLLEYGLSPSQAMKVYKRYQGLALEKIKEDPYQLMEDIQGIGFLRADALAQGMGIAADDPRRIRASLMYVIDKIAIQRGHTYVLYQQLASSALQYLSKKSPKPPTQHQLDQQIENLVKRQQIYVEGDFMFIPALVKSERGAARHLLRLLGEDSGLFEPGDILERLKAKLGISYSIEQEQAILMALKEPVSIITGGPGTGKTTVVNGVLEAFKMLEPDKDKIALAAPTGRAAKRMTETTGMKASTIHRLLNYGADGVFQVDEDHPLQTDLLIIDESSMLDTILADQLFQSIPSSSRLILVGDDNQLPSVGPGQVLKDLIDSGKIPVTKLETVHRQAADSSIIGLAHAIKQGKLPPDIHQKKPDRLFVPCPLAQIKSILGQVVENALKKGYTASDLQVLVPVYKGECGIDSLNVMLQGIFNPPEPGRRELETPGKVFRVGDKILQLANVPETGIMNGDVGEVIGISRKGEGTAKEDTLVADFDGTEASYGKKDLEQLTHAYCVSVHKSQGSEYPIVILPVTASYHMMLQKKLIYTAVTRAKKSLVIIGEEAALERGVKNEGDERQTTLKLRFGLDDPQEQPPSPNPYQEYFQLHEIPFTTLAEQGMDGVTPYDFMD